MLHWRCASPNGCGFPGGALPRVGGGGAARPCPRRRHQAIGHAPRSPEFGPRCVDGGCGHRVNRIRPFPKRFRAAINREPPMRVGAKAIWRPPRRATGNSTLQVRYSPFHSIRPQRRVCIRYACPERPAAKRDQDPRSQGPAESPAWVRQQVNRTGIRTDRAAPPLLAVMRHLHLRHTDLRGDLTLRHRLEETAYGECRAHVTTGHSADINCFADPVTASRSRSRLPIDVCDARIAVSDRAHPTISADRRRRATRHSTTD